MRSADLSHVILVGDTCAVLPLWSEGFELEAPGDALVTLGANYDTRVPVRSGCEQICVHVPESSLI